MSNITPANPLTVFFSYAHKDEKFKDELEVHLKILQRQGLIRSWNDRMIVAGKEWASEIDDNLKNADIILLLISADFIASDYCYEKELSTAIHRHETGEARVIPIFIRPCDWKETPFSKLQGLPKDAKPITSWKDQDEAWTDIANNLRKVVQSFSVSKAVEKTDKKPIPITDTNSTDSYLGELIQKYEGASWTKRAITLFVRDESEKTSPVNTALLDWLRVSNSSIAFLIGEFGSGKTWALKRFAKEVAELYESGQYNGFFPVFIPLVKVLQPSKNSIIVTNSLIPSISEKRKKFLFLFDGLDEVSFHATDNVEHIIRELINSAPANSRFVISCRTQAFSVLKHLLNINFTSPNEMVEDRTEWALQTVFSCPKVFEFCRITEVDAEKFLNLGPAASYWTKLENKKTYKKIIGQPVVLALVERALPELSNHKGTLTVSDIYRLAIEVWLKRDSHCNNLNISQNLWMNTLAELADLMFPGGLVDQKRANQHFSSQGNWSLMLDAMINVEILEVNDYKSIRFSHQSIWEYFFAIQIHRQLRDYNASLLAASNLIYQYATNCFLIPLLKQDPVLTPLTSGLVQPIFSTSESLKTGGFLSKPISRAEFQQFIYESKWRQNIGYGMWGTLNAPDGTPMMDGENVSIKGVGEVPFPQNTRQYSRINGDSSVSGISWYDAWLFCRWIGGRLPNLSTLEQSSSKATIDLAWSQDWYDEQNALIAVYDNKVHKTIGLNPDLRAENLGFRVFFPPKGGG